MSSHNPRTSSLARINRPAVPDAGKMEVATEGSFKVVETVKLVMVVLLKLKLPLVSDIGMYCVLEIVLTPTPSKYLELIA